MKLDGQNGEWVISGAEVKKTVDGNEVTTYDVADVYIEDGKIGAFWYTQEPLFQLSKFHLNF